MALAGRPVESYDVAARPLTLEPYEEGGNTTADCPCWADERRPADLSVAPPGLGDGARDEAGAGTTLVLADSTERQSSPAQLNPL